MSYRRLTRWGTARLARRMGRSVPAIGVLFALGAAASEIRRKGLLGGLIETTLNGLPVVGAAKNVFEMFRGDLIRDKRPSVP